MKSAVLFCFLGAGSLLPGYANAQKHPFSLVLTGQTHAIKGRLLYDNPIHDRMRMDTDFYGDNWLIGATLGLSPRYAVQATAGQVWFGLATETIPVPQDQTTAHTGGFSQNLIEYAVVLRHFYPSARRPGRAWFTDIGADLEDMSFSRPSGSSGFANVDRNQPDSPGIIGDMRMDVWNVTRLGLRAGVGREWQLSKYGYLAVELLYSRGLRDLQQYRLRTVVWQQGPAIDAVAYDNRVASRFSYVGAQLRYRFQFRAVPLLPRPARHRAASGATAP